VVSFTHLFTDSSKIKIMKKYFFLLIVPIYSPVSGVMHQRPQNLHAFMENEMGG